MQKFTSGFDPNPPFKNSWSFTQVRDKDANLNLSGFALYPPKYIRTILAYTSTRKWTQTDSYLLRTSMHPTIEVILAQLSADLGPARAQQL